MNNAKGNTSILIIATISILVFVGCNFIKSPTTNNTINAETRKSNPTAIKTVYSDTLKQLVIDGTITQTQSVIVLASITQNVSQGTGTLNSAGATNSAGTINGTGNPTGTIPSTNQLSALVTSNVITQAQADIINQRIQEAIKNN